jgi:two-component system response regulator VicR
MYIYDPTDHNMQKKIIIVDDNAENLEILKIIFEEEGYQVFTYDKGLNIEDILSVTPSLILLDINLPGRLGTEICAEIKGNEQVRYIPVILVSTNSNFEKIVNQCGADAYVEKPFDLFDLINVANEHIL